MVEACHFIQNQYQYIIMFIGLTVVAHSVLVSNESNKYILRKIIGFVITVIGCVLLYIRN
jgi:hypothetical protein